MIDTNEEDWIATLIHKDDYGRQNDEVAAVTSRRIIFVKGRTLALKAFEQIDYPIKECHRVQYRTVYALPAMIAGAISLLIAAYIVWGLFEYGTELEPGTVIRFGAIIAIAVFGWNRVSGVKRHELVFEMTLQSLKWRSRPGEFSSSTKIVARVLTFARDKGLVSENTRVEA